MTDRFEARWVTLREASAFVAKHHRHHVPPQGGIVAIGLFFPSTDMLIGVAIIGRPVSRVLEARRDCELTRLCVLPEYRNAASALLGRAKRVAQSLGFRRMVTYTLPEEGGASLRAAGMQCDIALTGGGEWTRPSRQRAEANYPVQRKQRWWVELKRQAELRV